MRSASVKATVLLGSALGTFGCGAGPGVEGIAAPWPMPGVGSPSGDDPVANPDNLVQPHEGEILAAMQLAAVYVGDETIDGVANRDTFLSWVIASNGYWTRLAQYGVSSGTLVYSARIATTAFFTADVLSAGFASQTQLEDAVASYIAILPGTANAAIFFLPTSIGLTASPGGAQQSCLAFGGFHTFVSGTNGQRPFPYAVIPLCANFPRDMPTSHELVEMATNPLATGWYDPQNGGEIADFCNFPVSQPIVYWSPSRFWSNADGACVPP
jgi:hypothetical protein